jgi:hypothetical protein
VKKNIKYQYRIVEEIPFTYNKLTRTFESDPDSKYWLVEDNRLIQEEFFFGLIKKERWTGWNRYELCGSYLRATTLLDYKINNLNPKKGTRTILEETGVLS